MIVAESIQQVNEILGKRREYFSRLEQADLASGIKFTDVDYAFALYLITRLGITSIHADTAKVGALFGSSSLAVSVAGDASTPATPVELKTSGPLYLFSPINHPPARWLQGATNPGAIALCYGLSSAIGNEFAETTKILAGSKDNQPVFMPLFGAAPGLWRAASMLIVRRSQQAKFAEVLNKFTSAFAGDDLDPLRLANENLKLREKVEQLSIPGASELEIQRLRSVIRSQETLIASLRRGALQQEITIAALSKTSGETSPPAHSNGHPIAAETQD